MHKFKTGQKITKLENQQKMHSAFSEASLHVPWCFIPQTKSPAQMIKWLKGYPVIFTYGREISNQSTHTNRETPSRYTTGRVNISVTTLVAYFSDICEYFIISFQVLNHLGGGFCLRYETPWYMKSTGILRNLIQRTQFPQFQ